MHSWSNLVESSQPGNGSHTTLEVASAPVRAHLALSSVALMLTVPPPLYAPSTSSAHSRICAVSPSSASSCSASE